MSRPAPEQISPGQPPTGGLRLQLVPSAAGGRRRLDWVTEFAIPLGIIGLLGSFLYYLIHLRSLAGGGASGALMWVCFFFLLGTVFVTRVRTKYGESAIAAPYIIGLAAAIGLFMFQFTMWAGSLVAGRMAGGVLVDLMLNYAIVALIWYGASRLTRECTAEDTTERAGEEGMLNDIAPGREGRRRRPIGDRRVTKHPGWLVMWFSLVAVIVFALGQRATRSLSEESVPFAFKCLLTYLFFAMALLALTSLSALRMQVRRKNLALSGAVAPAWIWTSAIAICAILAVAGILPRRDSERGRRPRDAVAESRTGREREGMAGPVEGQRRRDQRRRGEGDEPAAPGGKDAESQGAGERDGEGEGQRPGDTDAAGASGQEGSAAGGTSGEGAGQGRAAAQHTPPPGRDLMWLLKILAAILLALLALYVLYRLARPFVAWLRRATGWKLRVPPVFAAMLQRLQALLARILYLLRLRRLGGTVAADAHGIDRGTLADPFTDRSLAGRSPAEKVRHVYGAMLAYAELLGCPRAPEQTPLEYLRELPAQMAPIRHEAGTLTQYFVQASYTPQDITDEQVDSLKGIWSRLQGHIDAALAHEESAQPA
ncbi:MAG: DUF4129 domain-containing protein [Armatimonadota bacterium]|jgi:hypothetical protein